MTSPAPINLGPCQAWTTAEDIAACCVDVDTTVDLDQIAEEASEILFAISGHRFSGVCTSTVRPCPCATPCCVPTRGVDPAFPWAAGTWGGGWGWPGGWWLDQACSCQRLPTVRLAGYPVRQIIDVTIDGESLDPTEYRLDRRRDLVRLNGNRWPGCQRLDLNDGVGTWFVDYEHGMAPPLLGVRAATELSCELLKSCRQADDCELPAGTARVTRAGVTIDITALGLWLLGTARTGMHSVDAFLSVYATPTRRPVALSVPEADRFPLRVT